MDDVPGSIRALLADAETWLTAKVLVAATLAQAVAALAALALAWPLARPLRRALARLATRRWAVGILARAVAALAPLALPIVWLLLLWALLVVARAALWEHGLLDVAASLLTAWAVIRFASSTIRDPGWASAVAIGAWTVAALDIVGLLAPTLALLDSIALTLGSSRISALGILKGLIALAVLLWLSVGLAGVLERRLSGATALTPSIRVLVGKVARAALITLAIVAALGSVGIDLTAFAVFTGAFGVGLGFGLQKVVSNLVSGVILLLDRSVKPGDVIAVGDTYGWVNSMGARFVALVTRDGIEHLIPNEDLITQRVENWSYSNDRVRLHCRIGVSYESDPRQAIALAMAAAAECPRVLAEPKPNCLVLGFGDSAIELELRFWIRDPQNGTANVRSEVYLRIWDKFQAAGIVIPFPQRDVHVRAMPAA